MKWVIRLSAAAEPNKGFFMNPGYRYPKYALPPGSPPKPAELEVIEGMPVKSSITAPEDQSKAALGTVHHPRFCLGRRSKPSSAWKSRPMAAAAGGTRNCRRRSCPFAWRLWHLDWRPADPGYYTILSRATDSAGAGAADRRTVEPVGIPVECHRPSGNHRGAVVRAAAVKEKSMTGQIVAARGVFVATAGMCADPAVLARGEKEASRSCIPCHSLRFIHSQRLAQPRGTRNWTRWPAGARNHRSGSAAGVSGGQLRRRQGAGAFHDERWFCGREA